LTCFGAHHHQWRFYGSAGILAVGGALLAEKHCSGQDKKLLNGAIAATTLTNAGLFAMAPCMKNDVKPAIRALNIACNAAAGAVALKAALGK
jgi:hypothetical protein